ncbi:MAG: hypothetical protein LWW95_08125 [Candidatus Desulfofervidus auxilii]|nr:hypothetical protein [Candidatus Desulfofervidus auxilii]
MDKDLFKKWLKILQVFDGVLLVRSRILGETIAFCVREKINEYRNKGYVVYAPSEVIYLVLKKPNKEALITIHNIKKFLGGVIVEKRSD